MIIPSAHIRKVSGSKAFSLAELIVAMSVTSIILLAVATLASAMDKADTQTKDMSKYQAHVRLATVQLNELLRNCKMILAQNGNDLIVWRADDNNDNKINVRELSYIEAGPGRDYIRLMRFSWCPSWLDAGYLEKIDFLPGAYWNKTKLMAYCIESYTNLIPSCSSVTFMLNADPPDTTRVVIQYRYYDTDNDLKRYQLNASLRCRADNLKNPYIDGYYYSDDD